jgi:hypothetical protein
MDMKQKRAETDRMKELLNLMTFPVEPSGNRLNDLRTTEEESKIFKYQVCYSKKSSHLSNT